MDGFVSKYKEWIPKLKKARKKFHESFGEDFKELNELERQYKEELAKAYYEGTKDINDWLDCMEADIKILETFAKMEIFYRRFFND